MTNKKKNIRSRDMTWHLWPPFTTFQTTLKIIFLYVEENNLTVHLHTQTVSETNSRISSPKFQNF
jgi:hypothetical protein